jgi:nucleoside 2-deoxyribosyltransferase
MKIYTAASFPEQGRIRGHKESLFKLGHSVIASWLEEQIKPEGMTDEQFGRKMAAKDLREIAVADCFILDLLNPTKTMGKMVELGFALGNHKLIYVVAPENTLTKGHIFCLLADEIFPTWEALFEYFKNHHPDHKLTAVEYAKRATSEPATV